MLGRFLDPGRAAQALRQPAFRWFVLGRITGAPTGAMRAVAQGWLVYHLTGSALALAWITTVRSLVLIAVAPLGGVLCDRFQKRTILIWGRAILTLASLSLAMLLFTGHLQIWHIAVAALLEGIGFGLLDPALEAIVPELVDRQTLLNAISVTSVVEGLANIVAAAFAGLLIAWVGAGGVYLAMGVLFVLAGWTHIRLPLGVIVPRRAAGVYADLLAGVGYLRGSPVLLALFALVATRLLLSQPYTAFLPAFSSASLGFDATGLGVLTSVAGAGALIGSLAIISLTDLHHKAHLLGGTGAAAAVSILLLMLVRVVPAPFVFVALAAGFLAIADVVTRTMMQSACDPAFRGRISSVAMLLRSLIALTTLPAGALADRVGVPAVVSALALLVLMVHVAAVLLLPRFRQLH